MRSKGPRDEEKLNESGDVNMGERKGVTPLVGIVMGSDSDLPVMEEAEEGSQSIPRSL